MRTMITAAAVTLATMTAPAGASTLLMVDVAQDAGARLVQDAYFDQTFDRMTREGLLKPVGMHVDDGGSTTRRIELLQTPAPQGLGLRLGVRTLAASRRIDVTIDTGDGWLAYDANIIQDRAMTDGIRPPDQRSHETTRISGRTGVDPESHSPTFWHSYEMGGARRMLIGVLRP